MNIGWAFIWVMFMFDHKPFGFNYTAISLMGIVVLFTLIPVVRCLRPNWFDGNMFAFCEMAQGIQDPTQFRAIVCHNRVSPPVVIVSVVASHTEYYTVTVSHTDSEGHTEYSTETRSREVVTYTNSREFVYTSWEEIGHPIALNVNPILHAIFIPKFVLDSSANSDLADLEARMWNEGRMHDVHVSVTVSRDVPDFTYSAVGSVRGEVPDYMQYMNSRLGIVLWVFMFLLGYQSAYECLWCMSGERMKMRMVKLMSGSSKLRAEFRRKDEFAAETSFHV
jgi:hypothetical protein